MSAPIVQTNNAKFVSIIPENGTEFQEGQKIIFNLDPALGSLHTANSNIIHLYKTSKYLFKTKWYVIRNIR